MRELTTQEALQAIIDGKKVEIRGVIASCNEEWRLLNIHNTSIDVLTSGLFMFRLAQETITIGDVSFPKPESKPLEADTEYWVTQTDYETYVALDPFLWSDSPCDKMFLERGIVQLSRENAIEHAKALIKISGGTVDD